MPPFHRRNTAAVARLFVLLIYSFPILLYVEPSAELVNHQTQNTLFYSKASFCVSLTLWWPIFLYVEGMASAGQSKNESLNKTRKRENEN